MSDLPETKGVVTLWTQNFIPIATWDEGATLFLTLDRDGTRWSGKVARIEVCDGSMGPTRVFSDE